MSTPTPTTGTLTLLFTDIEGSTPQWERAPEAMRDALSRHDTLFRETITAHSGRVFRTIGDAFCAVFATAFDAVKCAVEAQQGLLSTDTLQVRIAISSGAVEMRDDDYFGPAVNRAARLLSIAHGGQIVLTTATAGLVRNTLPAGATLLDLGLHRLRGIDEPERIYQVVHPTLPSDFPALLSPQIFVHNMPRQLASFVGREAEIREWRELLKDPARRLFTVTGFGGIGKTRIAMRLAELCLEDYADGVWWCEQEEARSAEDMVTRLCSQLRVPVQPTPSMMEQLLQFIREKTLLIVIDNTEQVAGGASVVSDMLKEAPNIKCLVTSRRALDLRGETVLELAPLGNEEAIDLFVSRASECQPEFELSDDNRSDVTELCRRLEGVPLAIELAAARVVGMTPRQILQRLGERFRLLQSRSPDLSARQRALRGAIDWSYDLLSEDDKAVFAQLSVFAGGFSLDDAEAVCDSFDVFESIMELRQHSFFRIETYAETQQTRFQMLDLLREYGAEKLSELGETGKQTRRKHAEYYLRFAQERLELLRRAGEAEALQELERNAGNLRAAMDSARQMNDQLLLGELALANGAMLQRHGFLQDAVEATESGIHAVSNIGEEALALRAKLLQERAGLHFDFKEADLARQRALEAKSIYEGMHDSLGLARVENLLGQAAMLERDYPEARERFMEALGKFEAADDRIGIAIVQNNLGVVERRDRSGTPEEWDERAQKAELHLAEALRLRRELNDRRGLAETLNNLGVLAHERSERLRDLQTGAEEAARAELTVREATEWEQAWVHYREAIPFYIELHHTLGLGYTLANLGEVAENRKDFPRALRLFTASALLLQQVRSPVLDDVQSMLSRAAAAGQVSDEEISAIRSEAVALPHEEHVAWALGSENLTDSV